VADKENFRSTAGLVNVEPLLQESQWRWAKVVLTHKNPYTGMRYADDPSLAVLEIQNEDCIFWGFPLAALALGDELEVPENPGNRWQIKLPRHSARLKARWAQWLKKRYGSDERLSEVWGEGMLPGDSIDNPAMKLYVPADEMKSDGPPGRPREKKRMGDFIRFLADRQRGFYEKRIQQYRDVGYKGVCVTTAWRAQGPAAGPANLYCDTAGDMVSRHNYYGGGVGRHFIYPGSVRNSSHLSEPGSGILSSGMYQVENRAFCLTEWTSQPPNQYKLEAAPLFAFYDMGLQGWDASYHFLNSRNHIGNGWPGQRSYVTDTPHYIGQFPALAFAIYNRHVTPASAAAARRLDVEEIYEGIDALSQDFTGGGYDIKELTGNLKTPGELLAVGRVTVGFEGGSGELVDVDRYWDRLSRTVRSMTDELTWDYGRQRVILHGKKTQAIIGRPGTEPIDLPGVTATVTTPFVSLIFTPLDNADLVDSRQILITAMARDRQTETVYNEDGTELVLMGGAPLLMEPVQADICFKGAPPREVNILDVYGVPTGETVNVAPDGSFHIDGTCTTYYYEVRR